MAHCGRIECGRWCPDVLARSGRVGLRFDGAWYCSSNCLARRTRAVLRAANALAPWVPPAVTMPLGRWLVQQRVIGESELERALREQRGSGWRLGRQLAALGSATPEGVLAGLAAQAGVGYLTHLDEWRVRRGPGSLSRGTVKALGVVPFESSRDGERLSVACAAPLPRLAIGAIREMTGALVEAFIVADDLLPGLIDAYGLDRELGGVDTATLASVDDGAERIAALAELGDAERMVHTRCDPFVWVRLEGTRREDLLMPLAASDKEM